MAALRPTHITPPSGTPSARSGLPEPSRGHPKYLQRHSRVDSLRPTQRSGRSSGQRSVRTSVTCAGRNVAQGEGMSGVSVPKATVAQVPAVASLAVVGVETAAHPVAVPGQAPGLGSRVEPDLRCAGAFPDRQVPVDELVVVDRHVMIVDCHRASSDVTRRRTRRRPVRPVIRRPLAPRCAKSSGPVLRKRSDCELQDRRVSGRDVFMARQARHRCQAKRATQAVTGVCQH